MVNTNEKLCSALSYLVLGIIWFFLDADVRKSGFVKFHVQQAFALIAAGIILGLAGAVVPILGGIIQIVGTVLMIIWIIYGLVNSLNGTKKPLFLIGQFGKKFNI